ncbi:hypothetical protein FA95DRAFT_1681362 [Auriscalpium vulgare]|uniref:Uncharacterized protein n=1 Tax=Auriscalpium vulgare TaxID=40419 RepID=A0ACB8RKI3_9AGAM|nr:hypothetical protein FA95DRAFT_1681362 [Auriscalpium vulgare]
MDEEESLQAIDHKIEQHHRALQDLRARRNLFLPVACLIPDILSLILRFSIREAGTNDCASWDTIAHQRLWFGDMRTRYSSARRAIELSHVCRHWRAVARGDALLWTQLLMSSERWCWRMLERSKQAPLAVRVYLPSILKPTDHLYRSTYRTLGYMERVQHLLLSNGTSGVASDSLMAHLHKAAPLLRSLCLVNSGVTTWTKRETLSGSIFGGTSPPLRHIGISGYDIPWSLHLLRIPTVTHLELSTIINWKTAQLRSLLEILLKMPHLTVLALRDAIPSGTDDDGLRVELPRLAHLTLFDEFTECVSILEHIDQVPPTAVVRIWPNNVLEAPDARERVRSLLNLVAPFSKDSRTIHFTGRRRNPTLFLRVECWAKEITARSDLQPSQPPTSKVSLAIRCTSYPGPLPEVVRDIATIFSLQDIRTLSYEGVDREDYYLDAWKDALLLLHTTETLRTSAQTFAILLHVATREEDSSSILPHVHTLILDAVNITTNLFGKLRCFLALRRNILHTIKIYESAVRQSQVEELEGFVKVFWDKKEPSVLLHDMLLGDDVDHETLAGNISPVSFDLNGVDTTNPFEPAEECDDV